MTGACEYIVRDADDVPVTEDATITFNPTVTGLTASPSTGKFTYSGLALLGTTVTTATATYMGMTATATVTLDMATEPDDPVDPDEPVEPSDDPISGEEPAPNP